MDLYQGNREAPETKNWPHALQKYCSKTRC